MTDTNVPDTIPPQARAIARHWGGRDAEIIELKPGVWRFRHSDPEDGFIYQIWAPLRPFPVYEDSGRPAGHYDLEDWVVRCINDAPDAWWTIDQDGTYRPYGRDEVKLW